MWDSVMPVPSSCTTAAVVLMYLVFQRVFSYRCFDTFLDCKVHESDEQTVYQCFRCEEKFDSLDKLTEHETEPQREQTTRGGGGKNSRSSRSEKLNGTNLPKGVMFSNNPKHHGSSNSNHIYNLIFQLKMRQTCNQKARRSQRNLKRINFLLCAQRAGWSSDTSHR